MKNKQLVLGVCLVLGLCIQSSFAQIVYIDPDSGQAVAPSPEQTDALQQALQAVGKDRSKNFSDEGLQVVIEPDGSESVDLQGRFQSYLHATIDKNGKITIDHQSSGAESHQGSAQVHSVHDKAKP